ncbi:hypothetical protein [Paenibacillus tianjinensis]|uniref:Uncharacterized protein n=1 Tax=Paenibacillus tianjinensis TaxID=2810347 RepID=A0ABX7L5U8_9BACL|nr:hypothetical protein [Paenibacillus tianjinensis]QSF43252.1 hypothetical protein JRJ22_18470 [Paenibacillus tianjinensis]
MDESNNIEAIPEESVDYSYALTESLTAVFPMETGLTIGNFLKSLYSRIANVDKSEEYLSRAGVSVLTDSVVKDVHRLIYELATNWPNLSEDTKTIVSEGLSSQSHLNKFIELMNNFKK